MLEPPRGRPIGLLCWLLDQNMGGGRFVSTAQLSVQLRRLWLETYAPGQQPFVLSLRLPHRNAFRAPRAWRFRHAGVQRRHVWRNLDLSPEQARVRAGPQETLSE